MPRSAKSYATVGQRVDIQLATDLWERLLVQQVSGNHIYTNIPLEPNWIGVNIGATVEVRLIQKDGCYFYKTYVEGIRRMDNVQVMVLEPMSEMTRVQRRSYFRVDCTLPVHVDVFDLFEPDTVTQSFDTFTQNISEMGIRFQSDENIPFNSFFRCVYTVEDLEMERFGRVVFTLPSEKKRNAYQVAANLVGENEGEMQKLRKYLIALQRMNKR